ncbi:hypothetical protein Q8A67_014204 [Cirrhinus molitorella]|uniref:Uncharacterized protein n=1 Tax=Cirrhinus molitorella TaxID=172907 RepID=A0AA88PN89_9TELE|nr:hypothetical protein Q8A67_014204 [Cirrhinus molitorella]
MLETNAESSAANLESSPDEVLDKAESSFSPQSQSRKSLGTTRIKKSSSNQENTLDVSQEDNEKHKSLAVPSSPDFLK